MALDMSKYKKTRYFSGGVFISILFSALKNFDENGERITEEMAFIGLMGLIDSGFINNHGNKMKSAVSQYKNCKGNGATYFPLLDAIKMDAFSSIIIDKEKDKESYADLKIDTQKFIEAFIDQNIEKRKLLYATLWGAMKLDDYPGCEELTEIFHEENKTLADVILNTLRALDNVRKNNPLGVSFLNNEFDRSGSIYTPSSSLSKYYIKNVTANMLSDHITNTLNSTNLKIEDWHKEYLNRLFEKYDKIKTLIYDQPHPFYDFYVCNYLQYKFRILGTSILLKNMENADVSKLLNHSQYIIISGVGGIGKSMMMRHLLLDSVKNFNIYKKLPIYVLIKDYNSHYKDLFQFIKSKISNISSFFTENELENALKSGNCVILMDGLDEINTSTRTKFEKDLEAFVDKYTNNMFIISSRPYRTFINLNRFTVMNIQPFSKNQAKTLVNKLDFRPDEPQIKDNFIKRIDAELYSSHKIFVENPLLLTIMLMSFEQFAEIPIKMYQFYQEAYIVLTKKHDASKGGYKRELSTKVGATRFSDYFSKFCALTYIDQALDLSYQMFVSYFNQIKEIKDDNKSIGPDEFIEDLTIKTCLMFYEDSEYHFIHRSFQEYFCALFFSKQKDKNLYRIGMKLENMKSRLETDQALDMLYDMIPGKIEEYMFLPFLDNLINECESKDGYWTFLQKIYPVIKYDDGDVGDYCTETEPKSFLYRFIINVKQLKESINPEKIPFENDFCIDTFAEWIEDWNDEQYGGNNTVTPRGDIPYDYIAEFGDPDDCGYNMAIEIDKVIKIDKYKDLKKVISADDFPLRIEYNNIISYRNELKETCNESKEDLFDYLTE